MEHERADNSKQRISTAAFSAKFRSKSEVYQFLTIDVGAVLPPKECVTTYFLKDLVMGRKKCKYIFERADSSVVIK